MHELWKDINGFHGQYKISNYGRVLSSKRNKILKTWIWGGYKSVGLYKNGGRVKLRIHRLVGDAFLPDKYGKTQINHKDGDKENNHYHNLEWVTCSDNLSHAYKTGLKNPTAFKERGSPPYSKLNIDEVMIVKEMFKNGAKIKSLSSYFNVNKTTIWRIVKNKTWNYFLNIREEIKNDVD